jgi:hypothetical protein
MRPDPTLRDGVLKFDGGKLLNLDDPQQSRLAVYASSQAHAMVGTNYQPAEAAKVVAWAELEALAAGKMPAPTIESPVITPVVGQNTIDLGALGLTGTVFKFDYQPLATGMYLSRISVTAGAGGVRLTHPLFVVWDGNNPVPDPIDRFGDIDLTVAEMTTSRAAAPRCSSRSRPARRCRCTSRPRPSPTACRRRPTAAPPAAAARRSRSSPPRCAARSPRAAPAATPAATAAPPRPPT